jgi:pyruvate,orthophosphate dikinase
MAPRPVTVRLLDPPMHEFLPMEQQLLEELDNLRQLRGTVQGIGNLFSTMRMLKKHDDKGLAHLPPPFDERGSEMVEEAIARKEKMLRKVKELYEVNPMLGHRGVRLGITYPEIYEMQIRAILEATAECVKEGIQVFPEIMVPQVNTVQELMYVKQYVDKVREQIESEQRIKLNFKFGTMIEVVRACMRATKLAEIAEFFSFGTNDLTQATFSFSREDAENKFLPLYNETGILRDNPFEVLDVNGVGQLMRMTVELGRKSRKGLKIGICGEQGGHPDSIRFCHHIGLDYVSCSGPRVPIARLAAAHAKLLEDKYVIED